MLAFAISILLCTFLLALKPMINLVCSLFALRREEGSDNDYGVPRYTFDNNTYYPRGTKDVFETAFVLQQVLVADLIPYILDNAEYWTRSAAEKSQTAVCDSHRSHLPYLSIDIQEHESRWVRKVVFTVESRDQGWSSFPQDHGTYRNSWTWFDVALSKANGQGSPRRKKLFTNVHAGRVFTTHTIEWSIDSMDEGEREWVRNLRAGDMLSIVPMARYRGWVNRVSKARIEVFSAAVR